MVYNDVLNLTNHNIYAFSRHFKYKRIYTENKALLENTAAAAALTSYLQTKFHLISD